MHDYSDHFDFIILFIDILSLYVINLSVVLFANSSFMLLEMLDFFFFRKIGDARYVIVFNVLYYFKCQCHFVFVT